MRNALLALLALPLLSLACATPDLRIAESDQVRAERELAGGAPRWRPCPPTSASGSCTRTPPPA